MIFIYVLIIFLILLFLVLIKSTILSLAFRIVLREKIEQKKLLLPTLTSIVTLALLLTTAYILITSKNISLYDILIKIFMRIEFSYDTLKTIILYFGSAFLIFILLQIFILKLVYFPKNKENILDKQKLSFLHGLAISLFSFAIVFFFIVIFIYLGSYLGSVYIVT